MSWYNSIWPNFVDYIQSFEPYKEKSQNFIRFFGNSKEPPTGFKSRSLSWFNPVSNRFKFNCGYRMCCNVYRSCDHGCKYCYVKGYSGRVDTGIRNKGFIKRLQNDLKDFVVCNMLRGPVHISNSTDPLQERLEREHYDTYNTLQLLADHKDFFTEIIILTKNPGILLESSKNYLRILNQIREKLSIEISVAFFRNNFRFFEPSAPTPQSRIEALRELVRLGFNIRLRLDPVFPRDSEVQTDEDITSILDKSSGVQCVISKPLRLIKPRKGLTDPFYDQMSEHYAGGRKKGVEWHSGRYVYVEERVNKEMSFLSKQCEERKIPLFHCKETVLVNQKGVPLIHQKLKGEIIHG